MRHCATCFKHFCSSLLPCKYGPDSWRCAWQVLASNIYTVLCIAVCTAKFQNRVCVCCSNTVTSTYQTLTRRNIQQAWNLLRWEMLLITPNDDPRAYLMRYLRDHECWVWEIQNSQCAQIWSWCVTICDEHTKPNIVLALSVCRRQCKAL